MSCENDEKLQAKLRKLLALAERGEGGEKETAQRMLNKMLERHGMSIDDLATERRQIRWFGFRNSSERRLAIQILAKVCDTHSPDSYTNKRLPKNIGVMVTPAEAIEFELHYEALRKALAEHFKDAYSAFVQANHIFPASPRESKADAGSLSDRDLRMLAMAAAVEPTAVVGRIGKMKGAVND